MQTAFDDADYISIRHITGEKPCLVNQPVSPSLVGHMPYLASLSLVFCQSNLSTISGRQQTSRLWTGQTSILHYLCFVGRRPEVGLAEHLFSVSFTNWFWLSVDVQIVACWNAYSQQSPFVCGCPDCGLIIRMWHQPILYVHRRCLLSGTVMFVHSPLPYHTPQYKHWMVQSYLVALTSQKQVHLAAACSTGRGSTPTI